MTLDLHTVKEDFADMVQKVQPWTLSQFVMWLDLKVAEYKVHGYMILDYEDQLNKLFPFELRKQPSRNAPVTKQLDINTTKTHLRTAPSMISPPQKSVITLDDDITHDALNSSSSKPEFSRSRIAGCDFDSEGTSISNPATNHLSTRNTQVIHLDSQSSPSPPPPPHAPSSTSSSNYSRTSLSKPPSYHYINHESQSKLVPSGIQKPGLLHCRNITSSDQPPSNNNENNLTFSGHQAVLQGSIGSVGGRVRESGGQAVLSTSSQNTDSRLEAQANNNPNSNTCLARDDSHMELLMDVVIDDDDDDDEDYSASMDNWNSSSSISVQENSSNNFHSNKDKNLLPLLSRKREDFTNNSNLVNNNSNNASITTSSLINTTTNNNDNCSATNDKSDIIKLDLEAIDSATIPVADIKIEDVKHCLVDDDKFTLLTDKVNNSVTTHSNDYSDSDMEGENSHNSQHDAAGAKQLWTSVELKEFSSAVISRRRYFNNRLKPNISLPVFSGYLQNMLETGKAQLVWSKLVEQCAYHILAQKDIREKHDYREFCHALYQQYPSIGLEGPQPWSHFSKTLSQKIRHIRWQLKKRSTLGDTQKSTVPGMTDPASSPSNSGLTIPTNTLVSTTNTVPTISDIPLPSLQVLE
ncbi:probable serine/threonine-protein kinase DDB_G0282963 [Argonauta hians]